MKKSELKDGAIIEFRDGRERVLRGIEFLYTVAEHGLPAGSYSFDLGHYRNDLTNVTGAQYDIVKVTQPSKVLWERPEPVPTELGRRPICRSTRRPS